MMKHSASFRRVLVLVYGTVDSLSYEDAAPAGGFFGRLFG